MNAAACSELRRRSNKSEQQEMMSRDDAVWTVGLRHTHGNYTVSEQQEMMSRAKNWHADLVHSATGAPSFENFWNLYVYLLSFKDLLELSGSARSGGARA
jgi:UDP-N-acetyl-D-mannosaminuronic acid transferase (WecB/TagA/CpsF family)